MLIVEYAATNVTGNGNHCEEIILLLLNILLIITTAAETSMCGCQGERLQP